MRVPQERLYKIYNSLRYRVRHKNETMHFEWEHDFNVFKNWSVANGYNEELRLFRRDTDHGYFPENCIWASKSTEARKTKGRTKQFCSCGAVIARRGSKCVQCNALSRRKNIDFDRKAYARNWALVKKYGITLYEFNNMLELQNGQCAICNKVMEYPSSTRGQSLDVMALDHCHETGKVRSILCNACNKALGMFNDNEFIMEKALKYIKEHNATQIS